MSFRVFIAGSRHFTNDPVLRAAWDALLVNRLPDVELLTCGGRGVPMLAASYAAERGLVVTVRVADFVRFPVDAAERRDAFLVNEADAAVVVWADRGLSGGPVVEDQKCERKQPHKGASRGVNELSGTEPWSRSGRAGGPPPRP